MAALLGLTVTSCSKDDIGGTATESLAGDWYVTVDAVDEDGEVVIEDFNDGPFHVLTYNTAANESSQLYISDLGYFWDFTLVVNSDAKALTFSTYGAVANEAYEDCDVTIENGRIIKKGGVQNNGSVADAIDFYVSFSDDPYPARYGYAKYHIHGVRYSGLAEND